MISQCGMWLSIRRTREKCAKCIGGRLPNCKCPGCTKGIHYLPGTQRNLESGKAGLQRIITGSINAHRGKKRSAA